MRGWHRDPAAPDGFTPFEDTTTLQYNTAGQLVEIHGPHSKAGKDVYFTYDWQGYLKTRRNSEGQELRILSRTPEGRIQTAQVLDRYHPDAPTYELGYDIYGQTSWIRRGKYRLDFHPKPPAPIFYWPPGEPFRPDSPAPVFSQDPATSRFPPQSRAQPALPLWLTEGLLEWMIAPAKAAEGAPSEGVTLTGASGNEGATAIQDLLSINEQFQPAEPVTAENYLSVAQQILTQPGAEDALCSVLNPDACEEIADGQRYGNLARCVYGGVSCASPTDWQLIDPANIGLQESDFHEGPFHAYLFYDLAKNEYVLSFRGTDDGWDWVDNLGQGLLGITTAQYSKAMNLAEKLKVQLAPNLATGATLVTAGHSLGGGLATAAALKIDAQAYVFNAAALSPDVAAANNLTNYDDAASNVTLYYVEGEVLTTAQDLEPITIWVRGPYGWLIPVTLDGPSAPGRRVQLPAPDATWTENNLVPYPLLPAPLERSVLFHGMDAVLESLDEQSRELGCE